MKTDLFLRDPDSKMDPSSQEESLNSVWSKFEQTGSISVFLAYSQMANGSNAQAENQSILSAY